MQAAPALACRLIAVQRLIQPGLAYHNLDQVTYNAEQVGVVIQRGDYQVAALMGRTVGMIPSTIGMVREAGRFARAAFGIGSPRLNDYLRACFAAGTPVREKGREKGSG